MIAQNKDIVNDSEKIIRNLNKKAGNARWKLLAYRSFFCIKATRNGEVDSGKFLWYKKSAVLCRKARNSPIFMLWKIAKISFADGLPT